jgi:hypothetical protein
MAHFSSGKLKQQVALLASLLLLLTIGLCVLHSAFGCVDATDQGMPAGLCAGTVVVLASLLLFLSPGITGDVLIPRRPAFAAIYYDVFDRPPKTFSSVAVPPVLAFCRAA